MRMEFLEINGTWTPPRTNTSVIGHGGTSHPEVSVTMDAVTNNITAMTDVTGYYDPVSIPTFTTNATSTGHLWDEVENEVGPKWHMLALVSLIVACLVANMVVLVTVACSKRLRVPFYQLMSSLAVSDMICAATAMPAAVARALLGGAVPVWVCWAWQWSYLGCTGLRLSHVIVATLHCQLSLQNPSCCPLLISPCYVIGAIAISWILPVLLLLPYILLQVYPPEVSTDLYQCLWLDGIHFYAGVVPIFLIPCIAMVIVYAKVVSAINSQILMAQQLQPETNSEISSNGFVTYERSDSDNGNAGFCESAPVLKSSALPSTDLETEAGSIQNHEIPNHTGGNPLASISYDGEKETKDLASVESSATGTINSSVGCENSSTARDELNDGTIESSDKSGDNDSMIIHPDPISDEKVENLEGEDESDTSPELEKTDSKVSVVHVKGKTGKEALNEPVDDEDVKLHWELASILLNHNNGQLGVDNPGFDMDSDTSNDLPFSNSIKVRSLEGGDPGAAISDKTPDEADNMKTGVAESNGDIELPVSPTPSTGSAGTNDTQNDGCKSILKRDGNKRPSTKSVTFNIPPEKQNHRGRTKRGRLLSCRYNMKSGNKSLTPKKSPAANRADGKVSQKKDKVQELKSPNGMKLAESNLAKLQEFRYLSQVQSRQGKRLTARIKTKKTLARVLYFMFLLIVSCNAPYMISTSLMVFQTQVAETIPSHVYILFEWMGFFPPLIFPFLYLFIFSEFRKSVLSSCRSSATNFP